MSSTVINRIDSGIDCLSDDSGMMSKTTSFSKASMVLETAEAPEEEPEEAASSDPQTWKQKLWPPRGPTAKWVTWFIVLAAVYGAIWSVFPNKMAPNEGLFGLVITILLCIAAEQLVVKIPTPKGLPPLPPLLASLCMGLALRNIPYINVASKIDEEVSSVLREMALTVILTRAGLEIEPEAMKKVKWAVVRLAFTPCIVETTLIGLLGYYIMDFPLEWSFMAGFMIAAVSPAVVIPSLIILQSAGYGVDKGVPSLVMAASGIDDVLAIAGFTVLLGIAIPGGLEEEIVNFMWYGLYGEESNDLSSNYAVTEETYTASVSGYDSTTLTSNSTNEPPPPPRHIGKDVGGAVVQVIIGVVAGLVLGFFISYMPPQKMRYKHFCRGFLLLSIGVLFVFGTAVWGIPGSGALCALIMSFTASLHWKEDTEPLARAWHFMWVVFQPILFGLTGALVDVTMMDGETVGLGLAVLFIALIGRLMTSTAVTFGLNFNLKERLFVSVAWIPKGTVQAALGSAALEEAYRWNRPHNEVRWGEQILVLAVLITLITAPIGGFGIALAGPRLLKSNIIDDKNPKDNDAYDVETESGMGSTSASRRSSTDGSHYDGLEFKIKDPALDSIEEESDINDDLHIGDNGAS